MQFLREPEYIDPKFWGRSFWTMIESVICSYDATDKESCKKVESFLQNLRFLLPCLQCQSHYVSYLEEYPIKDEIISSKLDMWKWIHRLQTKIKERNGESFLSFEEYIVEVENKLDVAITKEGLQRLFQII